MRAVAIAAAALALAGCGGSEEPAPEPPPAAGAPIPSGGLTIEDALASDLDGPLMVRGNLVEVEGEPRLCSAVLESYPPQCGGPSLALEGDLAQLEGVENGEQASVLGEVEDGVLRLSATSR